MLKSLFPVAVVALLAPLALAQDKPAPTKPAPVPAEKPAEKHTDKSASAMASTLHVPVSGLTAENSEKVKTSLTAATNTIYVCEHCKKADAEAGTCCGQDRTAQTGTAFADVNVDSKTSTVSFSVPANRALRLSEVEKVLKANNVAIMQDKLQIGSDATVLVRGVTDTAGGDAVKKALTEAKLAEQADVVMSPNAKEAKLTIRKSGMTAATEARLKEAIGKANAGYTVADIVWSGPAKG
jgi:hypothetical protein